MRWEWLCGHKLRHEQLRCLRKCCKYLPHWPHWEAPMSSMLMSTASSAPTNNLATQAAVKGFVQRVKNYAMVAV